MIIIRPSSPSRGATTLKKALLAAGHKAVISYKRGVFKAKNKPVEWGKPSNKLADFKLFSEAGVRVPPYSVRDDAGWEPTFLKKGDIWFARTVLNGSCGQGIVVIRRDTPVPLAPLYVKYVPKREEYRVHVLNGAAIFVQQKRKKNGAPQTVDQKLIRNHGNGWVFCKENVVVSEETTQLAIKAAAALQLQVAAVDIIVGKDDGLAYVLECNSKPGLESPALINAYVEALTNDRIQSPPVHLPGDMAGDAEQP